MKMTEQRVKAVRLENFANPDWRGFLSQCLLPRYPGARIASRQPYVALVELRMGGLWEIEDDMFFAAMKQEGFFQRWEKLSELPPQPKHNGTLYRDIGYRVGEGEMLTRAQQEALLSQLHDLEERAISAVEDAKEQRIHAEQETEHRTRTAKDWNELVQALDQELRVKVYHQDDHWITEDAESGQILLRDVALPVLYRKVLRLRLEAGK
jgi:hypothetical protein